MSGWFHRTSERKYENQGNDDMKEKLSPNRCTEVPDSQSLRPMHYFQEAHPDFPYKDTLSMCAIADNIFVKRTGPKMVDALREIIATCACPLMRTKYDFTALSINEVFPGRQLPAPLIPTRRR